MSASWSISSAIPHPTFRPKRGRCLAVIAESLQALQSKIALLDREIARPGQGRIQ
jgi:hypothetical protein